MVRSPILGRIILARGAAGQVVLTHGAVAVPAFLTVFCGVALAFGAASAPISAASAAISAASAAISAASAAISRSAAVVGIVRVVRMVIVSKTI